MQNEREVSEVFNVVFLTLLQNSLRLCVCCTKLKTINFYLCTAPVPNLKLMKLCLKGTTFARIPFKSVKTKKIKQQVQINTNNKQRRREWLRWESWKLSKYEKTQINNWNALQVSLSYSMPKEKRLALLERFWLPNIKIKNTFLWHSWTRVAQKLNIAVDQSSLNFILTGCIICVRARSDKTYIT